MHATHSSQAPESPESGSRRDSLARTALYFVAVALLGFVLIGRQILPRQFLGDGYTIQRIAQHKTVASYDSSYLRIADVYEFLNLQNFPLIASLMGYGLMVLTVMYALGAARSAINSPTVFAVAAYCLLLGAIFLGWYSKDFLVLAVTVTMVRQLRQNEPASGWLWSLVPILAYALWFRTYWVVVALLFAGIYFWVRQYPPRSFRSLLTRVFLLSQVALVGATLLVPVFTGKPADFARASANSGRVVYLEADSQIGRYVDVIEPLSTYLNLALTQTGLFLPWPLLAAPGARHIVYAVAIASLWIVSARALAARFEQLAPPRRELISMGVSFMVALVTVQAMFEPDFGSYLRHLTPALPILLAVLSESHARSDIAGQNGTAQQL